MTPSSKLLAPAPIGYSLPSNSAAKLSPLGTVFSRLAEAAADVVHVLLARSIEACAPAHVSLAR